MGIPWVYHANSTGLWYILLLVRLSRLLCSEVWEVCHMHLCHPASKCTVPRSVPHAGKSSEGSLKFPSWELFTMFQGIKCKISSMLQENLHCVDTFWNILDAIKDCAVQNDGCFANKASLTAEPLQSYIVLRMHFATKDACKNLSVSKQVASFQKKAKLVWNIVLLQLFNGHSVSLQ